MTLTKDEERIYFAMLDWMEKDEHRVRHELLHECDGTEASGTIINDRQIARFVQAMEKIGATDAMRKKFRDVEQEATQNRLKEFMKSGITKEEAIAKHREMWPEAAV